MRIELNWDCSNADEVARLIFEKEVKPFKYTAPEDSWRDFLVNDFNRYKEEMKMRFRVRATGKYTKDGVNDKDLSYYDNYGNYVRVIPEEGREWDVDAERKEKLESLGFVTVVEEIKEEKEEKKEKTEKTKTSKTKKEKTTKK